MLSRTLAGALVFQTPGSLRINAAGERGNEIRVSLAKAEALYVLLLGISALTCHSFALLRCAVTASAEQPLLSFVGAGCRRGCGPVDAGEMLTCTDRPDGSGARSGRLQLPGCVRTAP